ncbi:MAG TPA: lipoprotein-releasing ABC transporter permease subunit [Sphingomonadales bacterium]
MIRTYEWMVASRYLRARRSESFISVIAIFSMVGIMLGVATLIIVMAVMNGFREELLSRVIGFNGHMLVQGYGGTLPGYDEIAARVRTVDRVVSVAPIIEGHVLASAHGRADGAMVRGMKAEDLEAREAIGGNIRAGSLDEFLPGENVVVVGTGFLENYRLNIGDEVTLLAPKGASSPFGVVPRAAQFRIVAAYEVGEYNYDSRFLFMPLDRAQSYFQMGDTVHGVEIFLTHPDLVREMLPAIAAAVRVPARVVSWEQINPALFSALEVERNVMFLILTLIILVAVFNIISSLIMLVKDKGQDIAILRTMGVSRASIMRIFVIAGSSIGVIGTLLGFVIGTLFCMNIQRIQHAVEWVIGAELWSPELRFLSEIPARMDNVEVVAVVVMALVLSFLATLYPSWRAARLDPVEALRYE